MMNLHRSEKIVALILSSVVLVIAFVVLLEFSGCGNSKPKDITNDPSYGNFSAVVGPWKTKCPLWLMEIDGKPYLVATGEHYNETYRDIATLPPGTEISIDRLTVNPTFEGDMFQAWGSLISGPYSNKFFGLDQRLFGPNCRKSLGMGEPLKQGETWSVAPDKLERPSQTSRLSL